MSNKKKSTKNAKDFLVSTADFAAYYNGVLACTGTTNLNTSIEVSMQEQNVNAGKGNQLIYSYKYGRELAVNLEAANWDIRFIAMQTGSLIKEGLEDVYKLAECVQITNGIGVLKSAPIGQVAVEFSNGVIISVDPDGTTIDLTKHGVENETVKVTYMYNRVAKSIVIDSESSPFVYELVLSADKHNNRLGKVGTVQIIIPSYQPSGNFTMSFTPDGVSSTTIEGKALSVEGDSCSDGSAVYAYVKEFDETNKALAVAEIAATPANMDLVTGGTGEISVIGLKGTLYSPIQLENTDCIFASDNTASVEVSTDGVVTAVSSGSATVSVEYDGKEDTIEVVVDGVVTPKREEISKDILTVANLTDTMLGKSVSDMIGDNVKVMNDGSVTGTLKFVDNFVGFSSKVSEQSGHYFPVKLTQSGTKMTLKTNGTAKANKTDMNFDPELLLRVTDNNTTFTVEVDGTEVITFNFKNATLA